MEDDRMAWYHEVGYALASLVRRRRQEAELSEEVRSPIEMETRRSIQAGMSPDIARRQALGQFGGVELHKDGVRDERGTGWLVHGGDDGARGAGALLLPPGFPALPTLALALGIGATTPLFGVVKRVLLPPLPYGNPDGIAVVW